MDKTNKHHRRTVRREWLFYKWEISEIERKADECGMRAGEWVRHVIMAAATQNKNRERELA
jgi:hypothetical protein